MRFVLRPIAAASEEKGICFPHRHVLICNLPYVLFVQGMQAGLLLVVLQDGDGAPRARFPE
jgi:hypothetical protein